MRKLIGRTVQVMSVPRRRLSLSRWELPRTAPRERASQTPGNGVGDDAQVVETARVLLIEDEPGIVDFVRRGLEGEGFVVEAAYDGVEGERLALAGGFDAIVLDLMLPRSQRPGGAGVGAAGDAGRAGDRADGARRDRGPRRAGSTPAPPTTWSKPFSMAELAARAARAAADHRAGVRQHAVARRASRSTC